MTWLQTAIRALKIPVILPAALNLQIINAIRIQSLSLFFTEPNAYDPPFSTPATAATFQLPFAFPVDLKKVGGKIGANYLSADFASLDVPPVDTMTDVVARVVTLAFSDIPFKAAECVIRRTLSRSQSLGLLAVPHRYDRSGQHRLRSARQRRCRCEHGDRPARHQRHRFLCRHLATRSARSQR